MTAFSHNRRQMGFTLIEIMLSLLVVAVGIVASIGLLGTALDTSAKSHDDLNIVSFADMVLNYCQSADFGMVPTEGTLAVPDYEQGTAELSIGSIEPFVCTVPGFEGTPKEAYTVSFLLDVVLEGNVKVLELQVWPGYATNGRPRRFSTEIYDWSGN